MSRELQQNVKIVFAVTNPCWDWYTSEVVGVKSPLAGLKSTLRLAAGRWRSPRHLQDTVALLADRARLQALGVEGAGAGAGAGAGLGDRSPAERVLMLTWHIVRNRAWTLSSFECPPQAYARVLGANKQDAEVLLHAYLII